MRSLSQDDLARTYAVSDTTLFRFALEYLRPKRRLIGIAFVFIISFSLLGLVPELLIRQIIDRDIQNADLSGLNRSIALMGAIYIVTWALGFGYSYFTSKLGQTTIYEIRNDMYDKMLNQSQAYFDTNQSGIINSKITNDLETLSGFLGSSLINLLASIFQLIFIVIIMLLLDVWLSMLSFAMIPLLVILAFLIRGPLRSASRATRKSIAKVTENLSENISGVKVTKTFARERRNIQEFEKVNKENYDASMRATRVFALFFPLVNIISAIGIASLYIFAGYQTAEISNRIYTVGLLATFMAYLNRFFSPVFQLSMFYSVFQSALASLERVYTFLHEDIVVQEHLDATELQIHQGEIFFDSVTFGYRKDLPVLTDLTLRLEPGKMTAIVGETGAGKSTIMKLITRNYDPLLGSISIDGVDIEQSTFSSLRQSMAIVPQNTKIFDTTLLENLRYGSPQASIEDVVEVAESIGLHDYIIALPDQYDTRVHEEGRLLSQGQRQLVSFARALVRQPKIILLDEATSSLDPISELRVQEAFLEMIKSRTVIVIAHRLSTIRNADRILVLEEGKIIQDGDHKNLVKQAGKYQDLYLKQYLEVVAPN